MKRLILKTLVAAAAVAAFGAAQAQDKTIKFATQNPKGHPIVMGMEKFAEIVAAKSGGKIKVNLFPGGTLGSDQANVSAIQGGTLEMASMNSGIFASQVKEFAAYDFPFMFTNTKEADAVMDGPFGKKLHDKLQDKGLVGLAYYELGFRNITNSKRPITKVEDLEGLKLRVIPNPINVEWVKAVGANPTPLPFPEVYAALEQKAIDGQENPLTVINANKLYEVQKHVVLSNHQYNPQSVIISKKFWDGLDAGQKKIIADAAVESAKYQREQARGQVASALDNMKKNGMQVTELSAAEVGKLRDKMRPVIAKFGVSVGQDTVKELQAELEKARK
ncbi:TRAP transporter substrate-binding protein [Hydrogenophaga sp. OTU3427]|uniref:TRAP transporter substrate-binding protein n=1 Tax=Hydrogenophaga sp. OTU3427 TaxID=3043856 RepID=UPI00313DEC15